MRIYRLVILLKSDLKKEAKDKLLAEVKSWLGKLTSDEIESIGEKKLAYPIKKNQKGEYLLINFESDKIDDDFNKKMEINEGILRHLLVRVK